MHEKKSGYALGIVVFYSTRVDKLPMGCFPSTKAKVIAQTYNAVWDLLDDNGDEQVSSEELDKISTIIHSHQVEQCTISLDLLRKQDPTDYTLSIVSKKKGDIMKRSDFKRLATTIPHATWHGRVLPVLREGEISRLTKQQSAHTA